MKTMMTLIVLFLFTFSGLIPAPAIALAAEDSHAKHHMAEQYACPMHPEVTGAKTDTCQKCGMYLTQAAVPNYDCPMHPEVTGNQGDSCPKCGMHLEKKAISNEPPAHKHH